MKGWQWGLLTIGISLLIMASLTSLYIHESIQNAQVKEVHHYTDDKNELVTLSDRNLVDYVSRLNLNSKIRKVSWQSSVLSMTLQEQEGQTSHKRISDLIRIVQLAFDQTSNVKHLLLRSVVIDDQNIEHPVISLVAQRDAWMKLKLEVPEEDWPRLIREYFKLIDHTSL